MLKAREDESSRRCRWHGTKLLYCFLMGSMCMAAAATPPEEEQGKRGREVDEQLADTDQELLRDSLDVRQAVDDWTPSQVAHWLKKEGVTPLSSIVLCKLFKRNYLTQVKTFRVLAS